MWLEHLLLNQFPGGESNVTLLAKGTFSISHGETAALSGPPIPFFESDKLIGGTDPLLFPVQHESDLVPWKPMTDVIIHGKAHAPRGKKARYFDAGISIGEYLRRLRVFGNRTVDASGLFLKFTEPELFEEMPLHFGLAYGGTDTRSELDPPPAYPRNPVGKGFVIDAAREKLHGMPLPNLENPNHLLTPGDLQIKKFSHWNKAPEPRAFGFLSRHAHSRMQQMRMNTPFAGLNGAAPWMQFPHLKGDEKIALGYMDADYPNFEFKLPGIQIIGTIRCGEFESEKPLELIQLDLFKEVNLISVLYAFHCLIPMEVFDPNSITSFCSFEEAS